VRCSNSGQMAPVAPYFDSHQNEMAEQARAQSPNHAAMGPPQRGIYYLAGGEDVQRVPGKKGLVHPALSGKQVRVPQQTDLAGNPLSVPPDLVGK